MCNLYRYHLFFVIFFVCGVYPQNFYGQSGWEWGANSRSYSYDPDLSEGLWSIGWSNIVSDKFGNVFLSGVNTGDSARFGPFLVSNPGNVEQLIIVKVDSSGNYQWVYSNIGYYNYPFCMAADTAGNLYFLNLRTPDGAPSGAVLLEKLSPGGRLISQIEMDGASGLGIDDSSNYYICYNGFPTHSVSLNKYNSSGSFIRATDFGSASATVGDITKGGGDYTNKVITVTGKGTSYIVGYNNGSTLSFGDSIIHSADSNFNFLVKISANGDPVWGVCINPNLEIVSLTTDNFENVYLTGWVYDTLIFGNDTIGHKNEYHFFVAKYSSSGAFQWIVADLSKSSATYGNCISADTCGNVWVSGYFQYGYLMQIGSDSITVPSYPTDPMFVVHLDTSGTFLGSSVFPTGGTNSGVNGITVDNKGNYYLGGQYYREIVFGNDTLTSLAYGDSINLFVAKYNYSDGKCAGLSVNPISELKDSFVVFPNPASNVLNVSSQTRITSIVIVNLVGKIVSEKNYNSDKVQIDISFLPPAMYLVRINGTEVRKFVKE